MLFPLRSKQQCWAFLLVLQVFLGSVVHPSTANLIDFFNPKCRRCRIWGTLLHYTDTTTKKCVETCVIFGRFYQSPTLKCGKCPPLPPSSNTVSLSPDDDTSYNITLDIDATTIEDVYRPAFVQARERWESIIVDDVLKYNVSQTAASITQCNVPVGQVIDDVWMCVKTGDLGDGIVAAYNVDLYRSGGDDIGLPIISSLTINPAYLAGMLADGSLSKLLTQTMGYMLGIGLLWEETLLAGPNPPCSYNYGSAASSEFRKLSGCSSAVPLSEEDCGSWRESCLSTELMTPVSSGSGAGVTGSALLSRITIGSLEDLGFHVNYTKADDLTISKASCCPTTAVRSRILAEDTKGSKSVADVENAPRLSDTGRAAAIATGKTILADAAARKAAAAAAAALEDHIQFVGDRAVGVMYTENGSYFTVMVRNTD